MTGFLVFLSIAILCSIAVHYWIRSYLLASALTGLLSITLFLVAACIVEGKSDALIGVAFIFGGGYAFATALVVGIPFVVWRRRNRPKPRGHCQSCGYNLTGNVSGICSECGQAIPFAAIQEKARP